MTLLEAQEFARKYIRGYGVNEETCRLCDYVLALDPPSPQPAPGTDTLRSYIQRRMAELSDSRSPYDGTAAAELGTVLEMFNSSQTAPGDAIAEDDCYERVPRGALTVQRLRVEELEEAVAALLRVVRSAQSAAVTTQNDVAKEKLLAAISALPSWLHRRLGSNTAVASNHAQQEIVALVAKLNSGCQYEAAQMIEKLHGYWKQERADNLMWRDQALQIREITSSTERLGFESIAVLGLRQRAEKAESELAQVLANNRIHANRMVSEDVCDAIRRADEAASVFHDYICHPHIQGADKRAANDAIWTIHNSLRPLIR